MQNTTLKYNFKIRTRHGLVVDNLSIHGRDEADAVRKLRQMYTHCEIIETCIAAGSRKASPMTFEEVVSLISK